MSISILFSLVFLPFILSFVLTSFLTPIFIKINMKLGIVDDPLRHRHPALLHKKIVPRGGGLPYFLGIFLISLFLLPINSKTIGIFSAGFIALAVGVYDDKLNAEGKDISPTLRLLINIVCAIIVVVSGVTSTFITNPFGGILHLNAPLSPLLPMITIANILYVLWIVWVMNMLNWSSGIDGQISGIMAIAATIIGIISLRFSTTDQTVTLDTTLSFIIAGASLGFLIYHFHPAKIFPGYGATSVYLLLAVVSILSSAKLATAILVMGVPMVDAGFTIVRRIASGRSPLLHDRLHLHHLLLKLGYGQRQIALFYWVLSAILGIAALTLQSTNKFLALIMLVAIVGGGLLFLHYITQDKDENIPS